MTVRCFSREALGTVVRGDRARSDVRFPRRSRRRRCRRGAEPWRRAPIVEAFTSTNVPALAPSWRTRSRAQVAERAHERAPAPIDGVDGDDVRAHLGSGADARPAAEHGERLDDGVGLDLDVGFDPGRRRDRRSVTPASMCARDDPVAQRGGRGGQLHPRVDAVDLAPVEARDTRQPRAPASTRHAHGVGQVELALRVVRRRDARERPRAPAARTRRRTSSPPGSHSCSDVASAASTIPASRPASVA